MNFDATSAGPRFDVGTRLNILERLQGPGDRNSLRAGDLGNFYNVNGAWHLTGTIRSRFGNDAIAEMADGSSWLLTPIGPNELDSSLRTKGMYSEEWAVRERL